MPFFILIVTLFSVLFMYILIGGLPANITCFSIVILNIITWYRLYDTDYDMDTVQNMIDQVIQNLHSMVEVIFEIYCFCMTFFFIFLWRVSAGTDLIQQHIYGNQSALYFYWIHFIVTYLFSNFFLIQTIYNLVDFIQ